MPGAARVVLMLAGRSVMALPVADALALSRIVPEASASCSHTSRLARLPPLGVMMLAVTARGPAAARKEKTSAGSLAGVPSTPLTVVPAPSEVG